MSLHSIPLARVIWVGWNSSSTASSQKIGGCSKTLILSIFSIMFLNFGTDSIIRICWEKNFEVEMNFEIEKN